MVRRIFWEGLAAPCTWPGWRASLEAGESEAAAPLTQAVAEQVQVSAVGLTGVGV